MAEQSAKERRNFSAVAPTSAACGAQRVTRWPSPRHCTCVRRHGGHAAGEVASESPWTSSATAHRRTLMPRLWDRPWKRRTAIIPRRPRGVSRAGMGCTCTAAMLEKRQARHLPRWATPRLPLHKGQMQQLTRDHSLGSTLSGRAKITTRPRPGVHPSARSSHPRLGR